VQGGILTEKLRKLKAVWSMEAQQDLRIMHNLDAEAELTRMIIEDFHAEMDHAIIKEELRIRQHEEARWSDPQYYGYFPDDPSQYITADEHYYEHRNETSINWQKEGF
jgi:hypothetical protein